MSNVLIPPTNSQLIYRKTDDVVADARWIVEESRRFAHVVADQTLVRRNWALGKRIAEEEAIEVDDAGHCTALVTQPQMIGAVSRGRPAPVDAVKPQRRIHADVVLVAVGQDIVSAPFEEFGMPANRGCFVAGLDLAVEGLPGVFVGGDCNTGPATAIKAIGAGKVAARNIDEYLGYHHKLDCGVEVPPAKPNDRTPKGRVQVAERPARERKLDFECVEEPMSLEEAVQECGRCLCCDHFGVGVLEGGRVQYV